MASRVACTNEIACSAVAGSPGPLETKMPSGPARLILNSKAAFISAYITYTKTGINIDFQEIGPIPTTGTEDEKVTALTQLMANNFAKGIKQTPVDWHMLQRIWVDEKN